MKDMIHERCSQFDTLCRFASQEVLIVPYNQLIENPKTNRLEPTLQTMWRKEALGTMCNQNSLWTRDVVQCPARMGLVKWCGVKADGCGIYPKLHTEAKIRWMVREDGDTTRTQEIVHFGQQVLGV
jgi:hypothetical protein